MQKTKINIKSNKKPDILFFKTFIMAGKTKTTPKKPRTPKAENPSNLTKAIYSTHYANEVGQYLDGQQIARNFRTYQRMYRISSDLRRCVEEIQQTTMKCGYLTKKINRTDAKEKIIEVPEFEKALKYGGKSVNNLKNDILQQLIIYGNAFIRKRKNIRQNVIGYEVLDTRYMRVVTDDDLNVLRYLYQNPIAQGNIYEFLPEEILHAKANTDFDNPIFWMTNLEGIVLDVMADEEANLSNYFFFQNDAIPSALFILEPGMEEDAQAAAFEQIKDTMKGGHNKHKNIVSGAVKDIKTFWKTHKDMDFLEQRKFTTEKICAALWVPRIILNYTDGVNYSNAQTQYTKFIENTIRPYEKFIEGIFTLLLLDFTTDVIFEVSDEHIDDFEQRANIALKLVSAGIWNRTRAKEYIGDELEQNEILDLYTVPSNTVLLDSLAAMDPNEADKIPPEELPAQV